MKKISETDWDKFTSIAFAVVFWSSEVGWITMSEPSSPAAAHQSYDACDSPKKMLLNYGQILRETKP